MATRDEARVSGNAAKEKRTAWLLANPELWRDKINPFQPKKHLPEIDVLAKAIHQAGLYSPNTIIQDIRPSVVKLLQKLQ